MLMQAGLSELTGALDVALDWDEATRTVRLSRGAVDAAGLGAVALAMTLGNVERGLFVPDPRPVAQSFPAFEIGEVTLSVTDKGINGFAAAAFTPPPAADGTREGPFAALRQQLVDPQTPDSSIARLLGGLDAYASAPGNTLSVTLKPRAKITIGDLMVAKPLESPPAGALLLERFEVTTKVSP
jgi:hypothetical protein